MSGLQSNCNLIDKRLNCLGHLEDRTNVVVLVTVVVMGLLKLRYFGIRKMYIFRLFPKNSIFMSFKYIRPRSTQQHQRFRLVTVVSKPERKYKRKRQVWP